MTSRRAYRSDLSDARWELIEPVLSAWRAARAGAGDTNGGKDLADQLARRYPAITAEWVDAVYKSGFLEHAGPSRHQLR